jgi:hypothetical protein
MKELNTKLFSECKELYTAFKDYYDHTQSINGVVGKQFSAKSLDEKEKVINKLFADEVAKRSKVSLADYDGDVAHYAQNPMVKAFADTISDQMIDMILPDVLGTSILGMIAEIRYIGWGDSAKFDLENNGLFTVAKAGYRQKNATFQKLENTSVTLAPIGHQVSVISSLFNVLTGRDSIAKYIMKAVRSIEAEMINEAYSAFTTAMTASATPSAFKIANYAETSAITLGEKVTAWNGGRKAVFAGTPVALKALLPSNSNYRYSLEDPYVKFGSVLKFNDFDVIPMQQFADYTSTSYALKLDDTKIFCVSPQADKIVKIVVGGTLSNSESGMDNANLAQTGMIFKQWDSACITNSVAGYIGTSAS